MTPPNTIDTLPSQVPVRPGFRRIRCVIAATNLNGDPDLFFVLVDATQDDIDSGRHYEAATRKAEDEGYETSLSFDEDDSAGAAMMPLFDWESASVVCTQDADDSAPPKASGGHVVFPLMVSVPETHQFVRNRGIEYAASDVCDYLGMCGVKAELADGYSQFEMEAAPAKLGRSLHFCKTDDDLVHQFQPTPYTCCHTCLAMVLGRPVAEVIDEVGEHAGMNTLELMGALARYNVMFALTQFGAMWTGWHMLTVPSLNVRGGTHKILVHWAGGKYRVLDPSPGIRYREDGNDLTSWSDVILVRPPIRPE